MDNSDLINFDENKGFPKTAPELDEPIPFNDSDPQPKPVSRKPINLGANLQVSTGVKPRPTSKPAVSAPVTNHAAGSGVQGTKGNRIANLKTFFTKLHPGALTFLDEQVSEWLKGNPGVNIKMTNVTVGDVMSKKTEPNLILNLWY